MRGILSALKRSPVSFLALLGSLAASVSLLLTIADPLSLYVALQGWIPLYAVVLGVGSLAALAGLVMYESPRISIPLEFFGKSVVGTSLIMYAIAATLTNGWESSQVLASTLFFLGVGFLIRTHQVMSVWNRSKRAGLDEEV